MITVIFTYIIGRSSDSFNKKTLIRAGSILVALCWFIFLFAKSAVQLFATVIFFGISFTMVDVPFSAMTYNKANKSNVIEYLVFREISLCIGRILLFVTVLLTAKLTSGFIFSGITSLFYMLF